MKKLSFTYEMSLSFDTPVRNHSFILIGCPHNTAIQRVYDLSIEVFPETKISESYDTFGNKLLSGRINEEHKTFGLRASGIVFTDQNKLMTQALQKFYKYPSRFTEWGNNLDSFYLDIPLTGEAAEVSFWMNRLFENFEYAKGATTVETTADEAMEMKKGVCQDYSHILISLLRHRKIPARYVSGFMPGEGETHAWVEYYDGNGWIGLDPTNNRFVDDQYIKLAVGRDFGDCILNKGIFQGTALQTQEISVKVDII